MKEKTKNSNFWVKQNSFSSILFCCLFAVLFFCLPPLGLHAADVTLSWDANTEPDLAGYKVYSGTSSTSYNGTTYNAGKFTSLVISGLQAGTTYYFAAKAYNTAGLESGFSNQVSYKVPTTTTTPPVSYTITASSGSGGSISPSGSVSASSGSSKSFTISPSTGYKIASVVVDGVNQGTPTSYTFSNVTANHSISATFSSTNTASYTITSSSGSGGYISPSGTVSVPSGANKTFNIRPYSGHGISYVSVDGSNKGRISSYTFYSVKANHRIYVRFW